MIAQRLRITPAEGEPYEITVSGWALEQWGIYSVQRKLPGISEQDSRMAPMMIRYLAYAETHRRAPRRPDYDSWSVGIDAVDVVDLEEPSAHPLEPSRG
jgi:hypothetical protein